MDDEERQHLEGLLRQHPRRLRLLERRKVTFGLNAPPEVLNGIDDIRSAIGQIQARLYGQTGVSAPKQTDVSVPKSAPEPIDLKRLRKQALTAFYTQNWERAVMLLIQLTAADPNDEDVREKLARAQGERRWQARYLEICELRDDDEWEAVLGALDDMEQERPGFPDPQKLRAWAEARQHREQHYDAALTAFDRTNWSAAITALEALLIGAPNDAEAQALLTRARAEQQAVEEQVRRKQEQARRQQREADRAQEQRFELAITLLRSKNFGEALDQFERLLQQPDDRARAVGSQPDRARRCAVGAAHAGGAPGGRGGRPTPRPPARTPRLLGAPNRAWPVYDG